MPQNLERSLKAKAWDEGYNKGYEFGHAWAQDTYDGPLEGPSNPYEEGPDMAETYDPKNPPPEPPIGTWVKDKYGGTTKRHPGGGWGPPAFFPAARWAPMWAARGPLTICGPWGAPLEEVAPEEEVRERITKDLDALAEEYKDTAAGPHYAHAARIARIAHEIADSGKPEEPTGFLAVVQDKFGALWVRNFEDSVAQPWARITDRGERGGRSLPTARGVRACYADISAVQVRSEGLERD